METNLTALNHLIDHEKLNRGGIIDLYYAPIDSILDFPAFLLPDGANGFVYNKPIDFYSGHDWLKVPIMPHNKVGWSMTEKASSHGTKYNIQCGGILTQHSTAISMQLHMMKKKEYIIRVKDRDGVELVIGDLDLPCRFSWSFKSGNGVGELKRYEIRWTVELLIPPIAQAV